MLSPSIYLQYKCKDYSGYFPTNRSVIVLTLVPNYSLGSSVLFRPKKRSHSEGRAKEERRHWPLLMTAVCLHLWPATGISEDPFETPSIAFRDKSIQLFLGKGTSFSSVTLCYVTITGARNVTQCYAEKMCQNPNREESTCLVCFS